jgi:hypothetical protein
MSTFLKKKKNPLCRVQNQTLGKDMPLPSAIFQHSAKIFFFLLPTFYLVLLHYPELLVQVWYISWTFYYISSIYFIYLIFWISQI